MNRLLIGVLDILNKALAILIVISSTISGYYGEFGGYMGPIPEGPLRQALATLAGFFLGVIFAALVSGLLAVVITASRELTLIRENLMSRPVYPPPR